MILNRIIKSFSNKILNVAIEAITVTERCRGKNPYKGEDYPEARSDYSYRKLMYATAFAVAKVGIPILLHIFFGEAKAAMIASAVIQDVFNEIKRKSQKIEY